MFERVDDIGRLLPSFQPYVRKMLAALSERGFKPIVHETYRSPERADMLARKGTGKPKSVHTDCAAVDFRCGEHGWSCHEHECGFFEAYGEIATDLGLYWGGHWTKRDLPHTQAIPATRGAQDKLRALTTMEAKDAFVQARLKALP